MALAVLEDLPVSAKVGARSARRLAGLLAVLLVAAPSLAAACPVCNPGLNDPAQFGFLKGTIFLSLLPPSLVGGIVLTIRRRLRRMDPDPAVALPFLPERPRPLPSPPGSAHPAAR
jgi:hypothetical protein